MCLAIYKPADVKIPEDYIRNGWSANSHGAGFAYASKGRLKVRKGFMNLGDLLKAWKQAENHSAVLHFRLATHGSRGPTMTHPFSVSDDLAVIHNGILEIQTTGDNSDTAEFVSMILSPMAKRDPYFFSRPDVQFMGEAAIRGSKFVFLHRSGKSVIWNEDSGHWKDGVWYSNNSYLGLASLFGHRWYKAHDKEAGRKCDVLESSDTYHDRLQEEWDERMREIDAQTSRSEYYLKLCKADRRVYEDLVSEGWIADDLDDVVSIGGVSELRRLFSPSTEKEAADERDATVLG